MSDAIQRILKVTRDFLFTEPSTAQFSKTELGYLNQSVDHVDLEHRMKQIERKHTTLRY
jgi:hypothetical protein